MKIVFLVSISIIFYTYFGYPAIVYIISLFYKKPVRRNLPYPTVSVLMAVHNEEKNIEKKMQSLLELDYPKSRIELLIGSDGSCDKTDELLSGYANERIKLYRKPERRGKPSMLNLLAKEAKGDILVFTDARQRLDKNSVYELVKNLADSRVGSVSAELYFEGGDNKAANGVGLYWRYEKFIRQCESKTGSMLGATGALYAIKRKLFPGLPADLILDDVYIPMKIVQQGYRAIFTNKARIYDRYSANPKEEFLRKTRTLAGNFQLLKYLGWLINPFRGIVSWQFISHKLLRLVMPFFLLLLFVSNVFLLEGVFYRAIFILQFLFYGFAVAGSIYKNTNKLFDIPNMFCVMNIAAVAGLYRFITKRQDVLWERV